MRNWKDWNYIILKNDLVLLTQLEHRHKHVLTEAASDPEIWLQHPQKNLYQPQYSYRHFNDALVNECGFVIEDRKHNEIIGMFSLYNYEPKDGSIMLGKSFLIKRCWGGEYNKAVKLLIYNYLFQIQSIQHIKIEIKDTNLRSIRANEKMGFKCIESDSSNDMNIYELTPKNFNELR